MTKPRGRHPVQRLTALRVKNATKPGRFADGNGLYLVVDPSGAKRWMLRTVIRGHRRDLGLGSLQLVTLADARVEAARCRLLARKGGDPLAERRRERRRTLTFQEAAKIVHEIQGKTFKNEKHKAQWISTLEDYAFPVVGSRPVDTIETADVLKVLLPIWSTKPETAKRVRQRIRTVLDWAKASGHRTDENPVDGVAKALPKAAKNGAHHAALPYADVPAFIEALRASNSSQSIKLAFEFLVLTAARTSEVIEARWDEIDRATKTWTVPADRIKAGREHRVPLSARCLQILDEAKALADGGPFLFPGRSPAHPLSNMVFLMLLRRLKREGITAHGFRSSFRDWAAERQATTPHHVIEAALAHVVKNKTEAAYFRSDVFELRRKLMTAWEKFATAARKADGKVVSIRA